MEVEDFDLTDYTYDISNIDFSVLDREKVLQCLKESGFADAIKEFMNNVDIFRGEAPISILAKEQIINGIEVDVLVKAIVRLVDYIEDMQNIEAINKFEETLDRSELDYQNAINFPEGQSSQIKAFYNLYLSSLHLSILYNALQDELNSVSIIEALSRMNMDVLKTLLEEIVRYFNDELNELTRSDDIIDEERLMETRAIKYKENFDEFKSCIFPEEFGTQIDTDEEPKKIREQYIFEQGSSSHALKVHNRNCFGKITPQTLPELRNIAEELGFKETKEMDREELCTVIINNLRK